MRPMNKRVPITESSIAEELARVASGLQEERTGRPPTATGAMVQVYLLTPSVTRGGNSDSVNGAEDDGVRVTPAAEMYVDSISSRQLYG